MKEQSKMSNGMRIKSDFTESPREEKEDQLLSDSEKLKNEFWQDFQAAPEKIVQSANCAYR